MTLPPTSSRLFGLDLLRALAIGYVMLSHGYVYSGELLDLRYYRWLVLDGVGLFFVLSGFLIGGILIRTLAEKAATGKELLSFWIRRWFRTLPAYYLVLVILLACYYAAHHHWPPKALHYFTFTQSFARPHPLFFGEAWSLAVEEWFYLLIPAGLFALLYLAKGKGGLILGWILAVLFFSTAFRMFKVMHHDYLAQGNLGEEIGKVVITRLDGLLWGMLGAWMQVYLPAFWQRCRQPLFFTGLLILLFTTTIGTHSFFCIAYLNYSLCAIGTLCLLPRLSSLESRPGRLVKVITFISSISYALYLTNHLLVLRGILPRLLVLLRIDPSQNAAGSALALALFWALSLFVAWLLYRFWEQPLMKLRDRFTIHR